MPRMNFSKTEQDVYSLTLDLARCNYSVADGEKITRLDLENHLRTQINDNILHGLTLFQALRRNQLVLFEIVEEIANVVIAEDVINSPFVDAFVEVKNRALGDMSAWYSEGGLVSVATFAGNHWDTNREAIDVGEEVTLPKEWMYVHVYEDLERFLTGNGTNSLERMLDKIYKSVNKFFSDRIYAMFTNIANAVPSEFSASGNSEDAVGDLVDLVQAAGGYSAMTIAGTKAALRKLAAVIPDKIIADSQREAKAKSGSIGDWDGNKLMVIPQTLASGTFTLALPKNKLFILGGDTKPIKFGILGDTRSDMDTEGKRNNDQSIDLQIQTKFEMGLILPPYFGVFTFA